MDDVLGGPRARWPPAATPRLGVRGSSMGGMLALHAAATGTRACARWSPSAPPGPTAWPGWSTTPGPSSSTPRAWSRRADGVARGYWHAIGDERVPWSSTFALAGLTADPVRLRIAPGGDHGSLQHDPAVIDETVAFLAEHLSVR